MEIILIAAMTQDRVIGYQNRIPWNLPSEQRFFKQVTMGHPLIMGRKTFESIGHPLPGRTNIVITSRQDCPFAGCLHVSSLDQALDHCRDRDKVFIIGGAQLYQEALVLADSLLLTLIDHPFPGDTFFPEFDSTTFPLVGQVAVLEPVPYTITLRRRTPLTPSRQQRDSSSPW
ncbi:dihydrofolate reductase [Desulfogranum mediterraneum]|uniref:dihydrofolate reductase n=1 Tax=Desulfogranum mediterraneum TaxID=160661 RepID=UPI0003FB50A3|nr:dihydrofolate reductase [Desulfogranum mediterraneum]